MDIIESQPFGHYYFSIGHFEARHSTKYYYLCFHYPFKLSENNEASFQLNFLSDISEATSLPEAEFAYIGSLGTMSGN